jgi:hypothetical protein
MNSTGINPRASKIPYRTPRWKMRKSWKFRNLLLLEIQMTKEYPLYSDIKRTMLFWAFFVIVLRELLILFTIVFGVDKADIGRQLLLVFAFACALYFIIQAYTEKIIISPSDITLYLPGLHISIKWKDIERISHIRTLGVSYEAVSVPKNKAIITGVQSFGVLGKKVSINLFRYAENWRDSELGQQIKQHAPHLFEKEKSA